jgi:1,4-dihydroxy-2-naphthoyl-CoA hydrolase
MKFQGSIEFTVIELGPDKVVSIMPIQTGIKNPFGVVQAGAMLWLADVTATILVLGGAVPSEGMQGFPLAISLNAHFLANQHEGAFRAVASFVKKGRSVSVVRTEVYGESDRVIADVTTSHVLST